jgi:hypothetical protein
MLRALTILAGLLTVAQAMVPASGQTSDHHADRSKPVTQDSQRHKQQSTPAPTRIQPASTQPNEQPGKTIVKDDAQKTVRISELPSVSITRDWIDRLAILFTGVLVGVGFFGVRAANETLRTIREQGSVMKQQADVMAIQAGHMEKQTEILADSAAVARKSAEIAQKSMDAMISRERARIRIELGDDIVLSGPARVRYTVHCHGSTEAFISESYAIAEASTSREPPHNTLLPMSLPAVLGQSATQHTVFIMNTLNFPESDMALIDGGQLFIHFYGIVKYKDAFGLLPRETEFCYTYRATDLKNLDGTVFKVWFKSGSTERNRET